MFFVSTLSIGYQQLNTDASQKSPKWCLVTTRNRQYQANFSTLKLTILFSLVSVYAYGWISLQCKLVFACKLNLSFLSYRISEAGAVHPRLRCTAKYPAERGGEGRRACGCHAPNLCPSVRQRHFNLHSMYTCVFTSVLLLLVTTFFVVYYVAFETQTV